MSSPNESPPIARGMKLRTLLILSQCGLLALLLLGFGGTMYRLVARGIYHQAESDLLDAADALIEQQQRGIAAADLSLSGQLLHRMGRAPRDHGYFALWDAAGNRLATHGKLPTTAKPADHVPPRLGPHPFAMVHANGDMHLHVRTPEGGQLMIGRPLAKEGDALRRLALQTILVGLVSLLIGCGVAWWLAVWIAAPIADIARTAESITSHNLAQRLAPTGTTEEVSRLATAFNAMLATLAAAFARQTRFTADASHELRTPVAVILAQAEHTLSRPRSGDEYREALLTCQRASLRMRRLIDDLLLLSRCDADRLALRQETVDLHEVAEQVVADLRASADARQMRVRLTGERAVVSGDRDKLTQVAVNLLTNAIEYSLPGAAITVETRLEGDAGVLSVADTGIGIATTDQPHIFERFYRVDPARTQDEVSGMGLGLSLVAEIVAAHGGAIDVGSEVGKGSTFTVRLPSAATSATPAAATGQTH